MKGNTLLAGILLLVIGIIMVGLAVFSPQNCQLVPGPNQLYCRTDIVQILLGVGVLAVGAVVVSVAALQARK